MSGGQSGRPLPHLRRLGDGQLSALRTPAKAALLDRAAAAGLPVPPGVVVREPTIRAHPADRIAEQLSRVLPDAAQVAVRSAFAAEDGTTSSNAGRFTSVLSVPVADPHALATAVADVLASAEGDGERAVVVQLMVAARHAGVAFVEPDHEDDLVDVVDGLADGLVGGRIEGARTRLPRVGPGERGDGDRWRGRLQEVLRGVRRVFGDAPGTPGWDVEWADDGERCWLVQVRPITAAPRRDELLTLANHREILPDPPSRLMTSLIVEAAPDAYGYWQGFASDLPSDRSFIEEYAGRPLINLSLLADTMRRLGLPTALVTNSMGGSHAVDDVPTVGLRPARLALHLPALVGLGVDQLRAPTNAEHAERTIDERTQELDGGFDDVLRAARDVYVALLHGMFALSSAIAGPLAVLQHLGVSAEHHARHRSAGTALWDDLGPLRALVDADAGRRATVEAGQVPQDDDFRRAWTAFLGAHGHRGQYESDLARPRYHEDPAPLLATLLVQDRTAAVPPRSAMGVVTLPLWWQASRAIRAREELRSGAMRGFDRLRQALLRRADQAVADGLLAAVDDVWSCTVDQLRALDRGVPVDPDALDLARDRHAELARLRLPDVVRRSDDPHQFDPERAGPADARLRGLPLTAGDVTGTVWRLDAPEHAPPTGDGPVVLVAPAVDAGWIATFAHVDAVVVETGGELSHGSIILRERGVPAVTNVGGATRLRDGQRVAVRAAAGVVEVLDR